MLHRCVICLAVVGGWLTPLCLCLVHWCGIFGCGQGCMMRGDLIGSYFVFGKAFGVLVLWGSSCVCWVGSVFLSSFYGVVACIVLWCLVWCVDLVSCVVVCAILCGVMWDIERNVCVVVMCVCLALVCVVMYIEVI